MPSPSYLSVKDLPASRTLEVLQLAGRLKRELRAGTQVELLVSDGVVEEFGGRAEPPVRRKKAKAPVCLTFAFPGPSVTGS